MFGFSKGRNETVDRTNPLTGPMTGLGLNGSTIQRKNSDSRSTSSNFSMGNNFEISTQTLMPVLVNMKQENELFKIEKQRICKQMQTLDGLTQKLINQNQALRMHYHQRTVDLQCLIKTLTLNSNQNLSQAKHLVHTFRQHNCILAKQIQEVNSQGEVLQEHISRVNKQLQQTNAIRLKLEDNLRSRMAKNKLIQKNIKKLETKRQMNKNQVLEKDICDLQIQNNMLKKKNLMTLKFIRSQRVTINTQKPEVKSQAIQAIKSAKMLNFDLQKMQDDYKNYTRSKEDLFAKRQKLDRQFLTKYSDTQYKRLNLRKLTDKLKQVQDRSMQLKISIQNSAKLKQKQQNIRSNLQKQLQMKRNRESEAELNHQKRKVVIKQQTNNKIFEIRSNIAKTELQYDHAVQKQLNPQKLQSDNLISTLKHQLTALEQDTLQLKEKLNSTSNPLRQIMRMELQIKKLKSSKN